VPSCWVLLLMPLIRGYRTFFGLWISTARGMTMMHQCITTFTTWTEWGAWLSLVTVVPRENCDETKCSSKNPYSNSESYLGELLPKPRYWLKVCREPHPLMLQFAEFELVGYATQSIAWSDWRVPNGPGRR
jgi:hypothetical protein